MGRDLEAHYRPITLNFAMLGSSLPHREHGARPEVDVQQDAALRRVLR